MKMLEYQNLSESLDFGRKSDKQERIEYSVTEESQMSVLRCPRCGSKAVYLEEKKAFFCEHCDSFIWTIVNCPGCTLTIRVASRVRPYRLECPGCGSQLTLSANDQLSASPQTPAPMGQLPQNLACSHCGSAVERDWWFCPVCSTKLWIAQIALRLKKCPDCSSPVEPEWHFCVFCKKEIRRSSEEEKAACIRETPRSKAAKPERSQALRQGPQFKQEDDSAGILEELGSTVNVQCPEPVKPDLQELPDINDGELELLNEADNEACFCPKCNQPVPDNASCCPNCGVEFEMGEVQSLPGKDGELEELEDLEDLDLLLDDEGLCEDLDAEELVDIDDLDLLEDLEEGLCPGCGKEVEREWVICRHCLEDLGKKKGTSVFCPVCGRKLNSRSKVCPYCLTDIPLH